MRVLGIDPGLTRCGVGIVEGSPGKPLTPVFHGVIRTAASAHIGERLDEIAQLLADYIRAYRPDAIAVERVFSQVNVSTVMGTAQASGVAILVGAQAKLPLSTYTPSEVKAAVSGSGRADKKQVQTMVARILRMSELPKPADAADALAIACCHIWRGGAKAKFDAAVIAAKAGIRQ
ncbi:Holliday junction endonuclease RuvC [Antricoccus suffuscus]|uniref:Crossover junction endodeoxyribonuclease RuvC n=1 Tax=Antricoccus suffuscus TaxID=1629062 RepID=A0A2T0ZW77_9ACTN|nr:crossover junction endodeoxyribonuclease RuvC [Antricoccus suffuscus]PRZ40606.1 Holliday junction endonuclease RuvC [Antricoccus suffuscus]